MSYNPVAQVDHIDAASQSSDSESVEQLSAQPALADQRAHESIVTVQQGLETLIDSTANSERYQSSGYELIEDDDYGEPDAKANTANSVTTQSRSLDHQTSVGAAALPAASTEIAAAPPHSSTSPEPLVRTSSDVSIPLRHPTPDLQSLQGAYVGNIERLEKSAERLSMTSSDIGLELRKLDLEQKRRLSASSSIHQGPDSPSTHRMSIGSLSNSIIAVNSAARSGGYSPGGFLTSPRGSIISGSRYRSTSVTSPLQEIQEPKQEEETMEVAAADMFAESDVPILTPRPLPAHFRADDDVEIQPLHAQAPYLDTPQRPLTAQSTDTYQQATNLFLDFDGVHFIPHPKDTDISSKLALNRQPLATSPQDHKEPPAGKDMIYYPAPIPKFLNLPQRLSKETAKRDNEKRRTQLMDMKSATDKDAKVDDAHGQRVSKRLSMLPPQLRASVFFDQPSSNLTSLDVELKNNSAVNTLDSILDASTHAPVSAFTDHPIVGSSGAKIYGSAGKKRTSRLSPGKGSADVSKPGLGSRASALFVPGEGLQAHSDAEGADREETHRLVREEHRHALRSVTSSDADSESNDSESDSSEDEGSDVEGSEGGEDDDVEEAEESDENEQMLFSRPNTLLAELEMRKQEQKLRTRSAAQSFPNGLHSTLLELDAVAQAQKNKRRQKLVTLAWEAEAAEHSDEGDDEDIPLGILYGSKNPANEERPLGLMERREQEENEPLSKRRARLRGEPVSMAIPNKRISTMTQLPIPPAADSDSDEGETLAQRLRRLKEERTDKRKSVISTEFETEIMSELGKFYPPDEPAAETVQKPNEKAPKKTVTDVDGEEEETLGQRRKRLQAEAAQAHKTQEPKNMRTSRSMADLLSAYPATRPGVTSSGDFNSRHMSLRPNTAQFHRMSTAFTVPASMSFHAGLAPAAGNFPPSMQPIYGSMPYNAALMSGGTHYAHNLATMPQQQNIVDPRQADVIDRWRQSVAR